VKIEAPVPQRISPLGRGVRADEVSENDMWSGVAWIRLLLDEEITGICGVHMSDCNALRCF